MRERPVQITGAVEGVVDESVLRRVARHVGVEVGPVYGREGKPYLRRRMAAFNAAARHGPWLVLIDLDNDADCAPQFRGQQVPTPSAFMCFRVAVREIEAWIMADREALAAYLHVAPEVIPPDPESLANAKATLIEIASRSRSRAIREDMIPRARSGAKIGPLYSARMIEFVNDSWRPGIAATVSDSLRRCLQRVGGVVESYRTHLYS